MISIYPVAKCGIKQKVWGRKAKLNRQKKKTAIVLLVGDLKSFLSKDFQFVIKKLRSGKLFGISKYIVIFYYSCPIHLDTTLLITPHS